MRAAVMTLDLPSLAAVVVVAGAVLAMSARDGRVVVIGLLVTMVGSPFIASPLPESLAITARIVGGLVAAYMLWLAVSSGSVENLGSSLGPIAEAAVAAAAFVVGLSIAPVDPIVGVLPGQAAAAALIALAIIPMVGRDIFRIGSAVALGSIGAVLLVETWSGPIPALGQLAVAGLLAGIAAATNLLIPAFDEAEAAFEPENDLSESMSEPVAGQASGSAVPAANVPQIEPSRSSGRSKAARPALPEPPTRKPMTAEPEADDWLAWSARPSRSGHRSHADHPNQATRKRNPKTGGAGETNEEPR